MAKSLEDLTESLDLDVRDVPVDQIGPDPDNPNEMSEGMYAALLNDIRQNGYTQPVLIRPVEGDIPFQIIDGEHRWRAVSELGFASIPAVVIEADTDDAKLRLITMNRFRGEFSPLRLAQVINGLAQHIPAETLRSRLNMSESEMRDTLSNANLADGLGQTLNDGDLQPEGKTVSVRCTDDQAAIIEAVLDAVASTKDERGAALARICHEWAKAQEAA